MPIQQMVRAPVCHLFAAALAGEVLGSISPTPERWTSAMAWVSAPSHRPSMDPSVNGCWSMGSRVARVAGGLQTARGAAAGGGRRQYWGTKASYAWEKALLSASTTLDPSGLFLCHPCAHLAWTGSAPAATTGAAELNGLPPVINFAEHNSAQRSLELPVQWPRVRGLALALEERGSAGGLVCEATIRDARGGGRELAVADESSLELALAHALVDRYVPVRVVRADRQHKTPHEDGDGSEERSVLTGRAMDGWAEVQVEGKHALGFLSPAVVRNTRVAEPCCWPKVWMFAKRLLADHPACWTGASGLGYVPVKWKPATGKWHAGNRHRVMAAQVAGVPFLARASAVQCLQSDLAPPLPRVALGRRECE